VRYLGPAFALLLVASPAAGQSTERGPDDGLVIDGETYVDEDLDGVVVIDEEPPAESAPPPRESADYETVVRADPPPRGGSDYRIRPSLHPAASRTRITSLLRLAPGLHLSQHSGEGKADQLFLRGFDAIHGQDVEVVVGGIVVNEPSNVHGQGYADLHFVIPEAVLTLRALEGSYDVRQGDFAVAGSLQLRLGMEERGIHLRGEYGSFGAWRTFVAWAPRSQPEETFVAVDYEAGDGFGPSRAWSRVRAMGQAVVDLPRSWTLRLLATSYAGRFDSAGVVRVDDLESGQAGFYDSYDPHQGGMSSRHQGLVEARYRGDRDRSSLAVYGLTRDLRLRHDFTGFTMEDPSQNGEARPRPGDLAEQLHQVVELGLTGSYRRLQLPWRWVRYIEAGVAVRHSRIDQSQRRLRSVDQQPWMEEISAELELTGVGLYLDAELRPTSWLALRGGVRLDALSALIHDRLGFDGAGGRRDALGFQASPRVTVEARATPELWAFASYGRGLRSPQALSLGDGEQAPLTSTHSGEVGLRFRRGERFEVRLAGFATYIEEDLVFDHSTGRTLHVGETIRAGAAGSLSLQLASFARLSSNLTWVRALFVEDGTEVPYAPPLVSRTDLTLGGEVAHFWRRHLRVELGAVLSVVGPRPLPFGEVSHAMVLVDANASARLGEVEVGITIRNLLDSRWRDGEFVYVSTFDQGAADPSLVPARHLTAGYPFTVMGHVALHI